jgi:pyruvate dehydrogenase E2 component (dihydrolipoamide acetyltransferase)
MAHQVIMPKLGQTMEEGTIVEWFKQEGDEVQRGEVLFTVETDKATLESESPARGFLRKILIPAGTTVPVLTPVAILTRTADEEISELRVGGSELGVEGPVAAEETPQPETVQLETAERAAGRIFASPRARMRAREVGVDLSLLAGTGPNGRIVERDVLAYVERQPKATPVARKMAAELGIDLATLTGSGVGGKITQEDVERVHKALAPTLALPRDQGREAAPTLALPRDQGREVALAPAIVLPPAEVAGTTPLSGLRGIIARRMALSAQATAHVTLISEADATALVEVRTRLKATVTEEWGFAPGYNDLLGLMVARALREFPYMNARLNGDVIERLAHVNLGLAVDAERGLLVPVLRDADGMGLRAFGTQFRELLARAREGKSLPDDLAGGTFTITNLGMYGVDAFTPIINPPEAAILGVGRIQPRPVVREGAVVVRQVVILSLTFDHRLVDGAPAAQFLQRIVQYVENPYLLLG